VSCAREKGLARFCYTQKRWAKTYPIDVPPPVFPRLTLLSEPKPIPPQDEIVVEAGSAPRPTLQEIWKHRELLYFLIWRDVKVRYRQTALGMSWVILQPLFLMGVLSVFLGFLAQMPSDGRPYPLFAFTALLPWQLFSTAVAKASNSLVLDERLITKVYFPRMLVPLAAIAGSTLDTLIVLPLLVIMLVYFGISVGPSMLAVPLFLLLCVLASFGISLWLAALNVRYRDVRHTLPFLLQVGLFLTPVAYPSSLVPDRWLLLYGLNPMVGVVEGFRWSVLGGTIPASSLLISSIVTTIVMLAAGVVYFGRTERVLADVI
jgi:lipopolysaccharide transport system permease protein